ncbi:MAG: BatA and WFA domain-containing protein, partial [Clostridia bacterium]|nr:BatA and WFA domain-containing protein [Clostridia bacterium]
MSFLYPIGLLGLIGIPVIILIYILQSKYTEQTVNSTYIWHLSDKFLKRKNPLSGMTGIISLILQLLMVLIISFAISRPIITLPGAAYNYCFVLDASSSMTMTEGKETRFEKAKDEIEKVIKKTKNGSSYTLITVSNEAVVEY